MKRFIALLRTTWWLWALFFGSGTVLYLLVDPVFVVCFPMFAFTFVWFAYMRFDEQGNRKEVD